MFYYYGVSFIVLGIVQDNKFRISYNVVYLFYTTHGNLYIVCVCIYLNVQKLFFALDWRK